MNIKLIKNCMMFIIVMILLIIFVKLSFAQQEQYDDWYKNCYRKLFFDFHTQKTAVEVAKDFDAERWAMELANANVQAVSIHSNCNYGWKYYRKGKYGYVHPQLPPNIDIIEQVTNACHKRGIKVIGYFNVLHSEPIAKDHPDWISMNAKGERQENTICLMSPYFEEMLLPQLEEYTRNYDVDGVFFDFLYTRQCYCPYCKEKFRKAAGKELPLSSDDPNWGIYVKWMLDSYREIRQRVFDAAHRGNKKTLIAVNWSYTFRQPEVPTKDVGFMSLDIFPNDQVFNASFVSKYWVTLGKPFDIMNSAFLQWWGDWGCKPAVTMMQECATAIANGGRTWIGYQLTPQYTVDKAIMEEFRKTFEFVKEREEFCNGATPVPYIAVLHSTNEYFTRKPTLYVNDVSLQAVHKMLMESGFHYNFVNDKTLLEKIDQYKVVILPDQRYIDDSLAGALRKFVQNGGGLIATVLSGTEDASFKPVVKFSLEDILGLKLEAKTYSQSHAYFVIKDEKLKKNVLDMPQQAFGEFVYVKPVTAQTLADLWDVYLRGDGQFILSSSPPGKYTGYPAITVNQFGKGKAAYISGDIFGAYTKRNQWNLKNIVKNLINVVLPEKLIEIDAPDVVEVVLSKKGNSTLVHLINHYGERSLGENIAITEDILPIRDISVKVKISGIPKSVKLMPENKELQWSMKDGMVSINVPELQIYSIVVVE